jgi:molybdopterin-guanine dinucleotide biosynthesis protein A
MTGAVLAGGRSSRMGTNKALIEFGGTPIIERLLGAIRPLFQEVAIVANDADAFAGLSVPVWPDRIPGTGALGGIYTAVSRAQFSYTFCIACDMPFPAAAVIAYLRDQTPGYDVVVPRTADGYHPLHAVYGKSCLPAMEAMLRAGLLRVDRLFPAVRLRTVEERELRPLDPALRCLVNVNTWQDLQAARLLAESPEPGM